MCMVKTGQNEAHQLSHHIQIASAAHLLNDVENRITKFAYTHMFYFCCGEREWHRKLPKNIRVH